MGNAEKKRASDEPIHTSEEEPIHKGGEGKEEKAKEEKARGENGTWRHWPGAGLCTHSSAPCATQQNHAAPHRHDPTKQRRKRCEAAELQRAQPMTAETTKKAPLHSPPPPPPLRCAVSNRWQAESARCHVDSDL